jgi:uncharacterized membrane protein
MNDPSSQAEWRSEFERLRQRLDRLAMAQLDEVAALRAEFEALRQRLEGAEEPPAPEEIAPVESQEPPVEPVLPEPLPSAPEPVAAPPPLPEAVFARQVAVTTAKPSAKGSFEQQLGRVWLVRIGIVLLLTGLVLGANWAYKNWIRDLSPALRLAGLYLVSFLIGGTGFRLAKKDGYRRYGEVLVAGGLAFFYYCTYAAHHVGRLRVIESPVLAAVLLLGAAGLIAAVSWFRQSRATAVMGILLASYATMVQPLGWLSAASNLVLSLAGIALMLRPGWGAPGIASLLGTYAAFGGWQILGAAGKGAGDTSAALWFLPGSWAIFAIPGMLGRFRESLGERGRTAFNAANNGLFFLCFSALWIGRFGRHDFWQVPACFGLVLLAMGVIGRKRDDHAAASNVVQALALLSLALVLKLDGYHLGLALAGESLALALAFRRFGKLAEGLFSLLAGLMAAGVICWQAGTGAHFPAWSGWLATGCVTAATLLFRDTTDRVSAGAAAKARFATSLLAIASVALLMFGGLHRLPPIWGLPVTVGCAAALAAVSFVWDRKRWLPEAAWASGVLGLSSLGAIGQSHAPASQAVALLLAVAACALWHRPQPQTTPKRGVTGDPATWPHVFAWLFAVLVPVLGLRGLGLWKLSPAGELLALVAAAMALVAIARVVKAVRLETGAQLLTFAALLTLGGRGGRPDWLAFGPALAAVVSLALVSVRREPVPRLPATAARLLLFVAWLIALHHAAPRGFIDLVALSAAAAFALTRYRQALAPLTAWGWLFVSLAAYLLALAGAGPGLHGYPFQGVGLVATVAGVALVTPRVPAKLQAFANRALPWLACGLFTLWSTDLVVDRYGWKAVVVLWTVSGFGLVTLGLVLSRVTSRKTGFLLLALALLKLFAVDVWDFTTFMRVVSFLALGLALVLLGLFYHRFAPAVKRLLEEDEARQ